MGGIEIGCMFKMGNRGEEKEEVEGWPLPKPWKTLEKVSNCLQAQEMGSSQHGFVKSKSYITDLSFCSRVKGLGDGEKVRVFHLDFCLDVVPHDRQIRSRIHHYVIASKMACAWKVHY